MNISLLRHYFTEKSTIGELLIDDKFECWILEDVARALGVKIKGATCIPQGQYLIKITYSNRFKKLLPIIWNEDNFTVSDLNGASWSGIRIHSGNDSQDTEGCLLPGNQRIKDRVINSVAAFNPLYEKLYNEIGTTGTVKFTIKNEQLP